MGTRARRRATATWMLVAAAAVGVAVTLGPGPDARAQTQQDPLRPRTDADDPEHIFKRDCAVCHGPDGGGTSRGPAIDEAGTGGVHFMLTTGYMPLANPDQPLRRRRPNYSAEEIEALVEYVGGFVRGPTVPEVQTHEYLVPKGAELFRLHCASCHQFIGVGGVLLGSNQAPTLHWATATEVVEAIRLGPGTMPKWSDREITEEEADAIAAFIVHEVQQPEDEGGIALGHFGPWSEGFVAWFGGLGALLAVSRWIGKRT